MQKVVRRDGAKRRLAKIIRENTTPPSYRLQRLDNVILPNRSGGGSHQIIYSSLRTQPALTFAKLGP